MLPKRKILITKMKTGGSYFFDIEIWRSSSFDKLCSNRNDIPKLLKKIIIEYLDKLIDLQEDLPSNQKSPNHPKIIATFINMRNVVMKAINPSDILLSATLLGFEIKWNNGKPYTTI